MECEWVAWLERVAGLEKHVTQAVRLSGRREEGYSKKVKVFRYKPDVALGVPGG